MQGFEFLQRLELAGNPVSEPPSGPGGGPPKARGANAYRDEVVLMSSSLVSLDGKEITMQQRRFLQDRERRWGRGAEWGWGDGSAHGAGGGESEWRARPQRRARHLIVRVMNGAE